MKFESREWKACGDYLRPVENQNLDSTSDLGSVSIFLK
jgi:hypothetical protein